MKTRLLFAMMAVLMVASSTVVLAGPGVGAVNSLDGALSIRQFPYKTSADIVQIALQELDYNGVAKDPVFGPRLLGAIPDVPVFVTSLDTTFPDYYMINLRQNGKVGVVAIVGVKNGMAEFLECHTFTPQDNYPAVGAQAALAIAQNNGLAVNGTPKLVFKVSAQCGGPAFPAWDLGNGVKVGQDGKVFTDFTPMPTLYHGPK